MKSINCKIINISLIIIGFLFINACSEDENKPDRTSEIYPLKIGNTWLYQIDIIPDLENNKDYVEDFIEIISDTLINDKIYYLYTSNKFVNHRIFINKEDGFYLNILEDYQADDKLEYKFPCEIGDSWENYNYSSIENEKSTTTVRSLNTKITVPYGTFECIEYEKINKLRLISDDTLYTRLQNFMKPGIGYIKIIISKKTNLDSVYKVDAIYELKSATIK